MRDEIKNLFLFSFNRFHSFDIVVIEKRENDNRLKTIYKFNNIIINNNNKSGDDLKAD